MRSMLGTLFAVLVLGALPTTAAAATCADYPNQAVAQKAADTRDADHDGIYCETLPCPCSKSSGSHKSPAAPSTPAKTKGCQHPLAVQNISFSATKYPALKAHADAAIARGWPRTLVLNRRGAGARRTRALANIATAPGMDRDEYPPAVGRGRGKGLEQGTNPRGWKTDVQLVPSSQNRGHGSVLGVKLRRFCDGVRFRYAWY